MMNNHALRRMASGACLALAALMPFGGAHAVTGTVTFSDSNCASWAMTTSGTNSFTFTCQSLTCSITATPGLTALPNTPITATGSCTPSSGSTTYTWRLVTTPAGNCPAPTPSPPNNQNVLTAAAVTTGGCLYQMSATDPVLGSGSATVTLDWEAVTQPPSGCTVTANPTTVPAAGGSVTLTATCGGGAVASWAWTKNGTAISGAASSTYTDTLAANSSTTQTITYQATATNALGSAQASAGVVWTGSGGGGGGGGGGAYNCSAQGFTNTLSADFNWSGTPPLQIFTSQLGSFGTNTAVVIGITTPSAVGGATNYGHVTAVEYGAQKYNRVMVLSTQPCDFAVSPPTLNSAGGSVANGTPEPALYFTVGGGQANSWWLTDLNTSTKYYLNIKNGNSNNTTSCPAGANCSMMIELSKPNGL